MKKSFFALLLFGVLPLAVSAQNPKGRFSVTPMAGINVTGFSGGTVDMYNYKVRMTAGAEAEYAVNAWLGLSLGVFYSQQGANIDWASAGTIIDAEGVEYYAGTEMDGKLHCDYLNFPLLANIYIPQVKGLAVKIGLQMGVLVNDKIEVATHMAAVPSDWSEYGELSFEQRYADLTKQVFSSIRMTGVSNSIDFGIPVGLSYEYKNITLNARYYFGLRKVDSTEDPDKAHNRYLSVTLGYRFHLK